MKWFGRLIATFTILMIVSYALVALLVPSAPNGASVSSQMAGSTDLAHQLLGRARSLNADDHKRME